MKCVLGSLGFVAVQLACNEQFLQMIADELGKWQHYSDGGSHKIDPFVYSRNRKLFYDIKYDFSSTCTNKSSCDVMTGFGV